MPEPLETRTACPVCDGHGTEAFLRRPAVPVHQNLLFPNAVAARSIGRGTLDLRVCGTCGFVFNAAFDSTLLDYGSAYENSQDHSPAFAAHLEELADRIVMGHGVHSGRVVEVGCGKGAFLTRLLSHPRNRSEGVGFDPTHLGPASALDGRVSFRKEFYHSGTAVPADVVICRHVIEHVPEPLGLLRTVRDAAGQGAVKVFFETPCVEWILRNRVPWDLFYEHCSLFTAHSLGLALTRAGFAVSTVRHVFGGQYLWAEASVGGVANAYDSGSVPTACLASGFGAWEAGQMARWSTLVNDLSSRGPVLVWGAGAKGTTFCNLVDPEKRRIAGVVDVNPAKQERFLGGTGHPILPASPDVLNAAAAVLVLNPNYAAEITAELTRSGSAARIIDLMAWEGGHAAHN